MTITLSQLERTAEQAYIDPSNAKTLLHEMNLILNQIEILHQVDVKNTKPLVHPVNSHQILRIDKVVDENYVEALAEVAPHFVDGHYLVPSVIRGK